MNTSDVSRRGFLGWTSAFALALGLPQFTRAQAAGESINFGYQNTSWGTVGMIAEAEDIFSKVGVKVVPYRFEGGKATRDAMVAGRVDIGCLGSTPFIVGATKGDMVAIGMAMYAGRTQSIVASAKSGIKTIADLKGRRIASQLGSATDYVFQNKILPKFGLSGSDVQVVNIPHPNHIAALASESVEAFAGVEPFPSLAEINKLGHIVIDYSEFDISPVILTANTNVVEKQRDDVVGFLKGWLTAINYFNSNQKGAADIVLKHFKEQGFDVSGDVIKLMLSKIEVRADFKPELTRFLNEEAEALVRQRQLAKVPDWNKVLNSALMQEAKA